MIGLYVHMPFCKAKCPYCDFYSIPVSKNSGIYSNKNIEKTVFVYTEAVIRNLEAYNERFDTVFFGGGTPSLHCWSVSSILSKTRFSDRAEITVEANPGDTSTQGLIMLRDSGVNRLSFGIQSFSNNELVALGRRHTAEDANNVIRVANELGFNNISADIMLGIPNQTPESLKRTIKVINSLPITHISAYMLKVEKNTPFAKTDLILPDDEKTALLYLTAVEALEASGFKQYEISNFAKSGFECKHNLKYWESEEYLGIGASAHSYYDGARFAVPRDIKAFISSEKQPLEITEANPRTFEEYAMLKLRLTDGLTFKECEIFGIDKEKIMKRTSFIPAEYINVTGKGISLTKNGFLLSNKIIERLIFDAPEEYN